MRNTLGFVETPYEIADFMIKLASVPKGAPVLDTGFGRGVFLRALLNQGYTCISGIEIQSDLYALGKKLYGPKARLIQGDFLSWDFSESYQLIVGNPPYIHYNQLPDPLKDVVAEISRTREGDIYYAFIRKAIDLLEPGGELIYIVPYHFLYNTHAKHLRTYLLTQGAFRLIIDLGEVRLFRDVSPETVIFKWQKQGFPEPIEVLRLTQMRSLHPAQVAEAAWAALQEHRSNALFEYYSIPPFSDSGPWSLQLPASSTDESTLLRQVARVGVGLVSGYDRAFIVPPEKLKQACSKCGQASNCPFLQPFAKARYCEPFELKDTTFYLLIPDNLQTEKELLSKCNTLVHQLWSHKEALQGRYLPAGKQWFHWQALRNYDFLARHLNRRRIYVPTMDRRPYNRFAIGEGGIWPGGDVLFIQPYDERDLIPLATYLNSRTFRESYLLLGYKRGGRVLFTQRLLEKVLLPSNWRHEIPAI